MQYSTQLLDHFHYPRNVGYIDNKGAQALVSSGNAGETHSGDSVQLQLQVDAHGVIIDVKFKAYGCGPTIATMSLLTELISGKSVEQAQQIDSQQLIDGLQLPAVKYHCASLALQALHEAVKQ